MNWKVKLVLLFGKLRKPIDAKNVANISELRKKSDRAARLGTFLFDKKVSVNHVTDVMANHVPVRIYRNSDEKNQRVILYFHGGGFVLYGIYSHDNVCRRLCATNNCIVVSVDYRLAPEYTYPVAHDDSLSALQWVRENIAAYGGNASDLVLAGDSAGGNLAACMAHRCREKNIPLKAQILIYPWIDGKLDNPSIDRNGKGYLLEKETVFWFRAQYTPRPEDRCAPHVSPCYETNFSQLPPAFVLTAEFDPLLDDGFKYAEQMKLHGVPVKYCEYKQLFHGFFNTPRVHPEAMKAFYDIKAFLNEYSNR